MVYLISAVAGQLLVIGGFIAFHLLVTRPRALRAAAARRYTKRLVAQVAKDRGISEQQAYNSMYL